MHTTHHPLPCRPLPLATLIACLFTGPAWSTESNGGSLAYRDDRSQVGIGIDDQGNIAGELRYLLSATATSGTVGDLWVGDGAGGIKLTYSWMPGDQDGKPDRAANMRKLFAALDQNNLQDRKLSLGGGLENARGYVAAYLSHSLSGNRHLADRQEVVTSTVNGSEDGRPYIDTLTQITTLRAYEHAFDWGIGVRAGRYLGEQGLRIGLGADHEWGDNDSRQTTLSADLEKSFAGSPWSLALRAEAALSDKGVTSRENDMRGWLILRYAFGDTPRTPATYSIRTQEHAVSAKPDAASAPTVAPSARIAAQVIPGASAETRVTQPAQPPVATTTKTEKRLVKTTATMTADTFFKFDSASLTPAANQALEKVVGVINAQGYTDKINLTGHTCDLGSEPYNQKLSLRRAESVKKYLVEQGKIKADDIAASGKGESDPLYPNTRVERAKNRRVDMEFLTYVDKEETFIVEVPATTTVQTVTAPPTVTVNASSATGQAAPVAPVAVPEIVIQRELVEAEPAWIQPALFGTVPHKRTVDYYRVTRASVATTSERTYLNRSPLASADTYTATNGQAVSMAVLANDSDPDGDSLGLQSVGQSAFGSAAIVGDRIVYTPNNATSSGVDSLTYTITDGKGGTATGTVTVNLIANGAPTAMDDRYVIPGIGSRLFDVLANDTDPDSDLLSILSYTQPLLGLVTLEDNRLRFTSTTMFSTLTFSYTIGDGFGGTSTATVTLIDP